MEQKISKYPFLYEIKVADIETSLEELLKGLKKLNEDYRKVLTRIHPLRNVIHYQIKYDAEKNPVTITLKITNIVRLSTRWFFKFIQEHASIEKYECIPNL